MCGIVGFAGSGDQSDLSRMMRAVAHRGPDAQGRYIDAEVPVFLGHQRLSVLDPSGGAQPMWTSDGQIGVVYNGEIYNHAELRNELVALGHMFRTDHSDTEVLLHGYREWGEGLPGRLNGMFAFCIYDRIKSQFFLSRDRFGEKPLYYAIQRDLFAFGSELSGIAAHRNFVARRDPVSLQKYFAYGYVPAPRTLLNNCFKLTGGTSLVYSLSTQHLRITSYALFHIATDPDMANRTDEDLAEELRALLFQSVKRRLISDVPLGIFLSGGVDSSAVLAGAANVLPPDQLKTFTLGFHEPSFDESEAAASVAAWFGADHKIDWLDLETAKAAIPQILAHLDEPMGDASIVPTTLLARFARKHVTVALSGDGGDELFAGYDPFRALAPARAYKALVPQPLHRLLQRTARCMPLSSRNMSLDFKVNRTLRGLGYDPSLWNPVWLSPVDPSEMRDLFESPLTPEALYSEALDVWNASDSPSLINRSLEFYTRFYLQDGILAKADRASMSASLESRSVFLDNDLADFCSRLPHEYKMRGKTQKFLLKKAVQDLLPPAIVKRAKKGFGMPTASWLKSVPETPPLAQVEGVNMDYVEKVWGDHRRGTADHRLFMWSWLSLQLLRTTSEIKSPSPADEGVDIL